MFYSKMEEQNEIQGGNDGRDRIARAGMTRSPVPKPPPRSAPAIPDHAPVPCPLCRPDATADHPGEPWPDCELCDGNGVVPSRQAAEWREEFC